MEPDGVEEGLDTGHPFQYELLVLQEIIASMQGTSDLKGALEQVSKAIVEVLGYDNLILGLLDRDKNVIKPAVTHTKLGEGLVANLILKSSWKILSLSPRGSEIPPRGLWFWPPTL